MLGSKSNGWLQMTLQYEGKWDKMPMFQNITIYKDYQIQQQKYKTINNLSLFNLSKPHGSCTYISRLRPSQVTTQLCRSALFTYFCSCLCNKF